MKKYLTQELQLQVLPELLEMFEEQRTRLTAMVQQLLTLVVTLDGVQQHLLPIKLQNPVYGL